MSEPNANSVRDNYRCQLKSGAALFVVGAVAIREGVDRQ